MLSWSIAESGKTGDLSDLEANQLVECLGSHETPSGHLWLAEVSHGGSFMPGGGNPIRHGGFPDVKDCRHVGSTTPNGIPSMDGLPNESK